MVGQRLLVTLLTSFIFIMPPATEGISVFDPYCNPESKLFSSKSLDSTWVTILAVALTHQ